MAFRLRIEPLDPLIARDGRPFGASSGGRMKTLEWPYPSVLAGSVRTLLGRRAGYTFTPDEIEKLKQLQVHGPLPVSGKQLFVPAPKDAVRHPGTKRFYAARPAGFQSEEGWDLSGQGLLPPLLPAELDDDFKPDTLPPFWSMDAAVRWLANPADSAFALSDREALPQLERDRRTHLSVDASTLAAQEGMLFTTEGIEFPEGVAMAARIHSPDGLTGALANGSELHGIGGERRLASFAADTQSDWSCPAVIESASASNTRIRMQLVTPAIFDRGWRPTWIAGPEQTGAALTLVSAVLGRWSPISGWSYEHRGPKAVRRMVPAGSVYFFQADRPPVNLPQCWLAPVSDLLQDRLDGFGLAIWGVW